MAGLSRNSSVQSITNFTVSAVYSPGLKIPVTVMVIPRITCDIPLRPVTAGHGWEYLSGITLADPDFGRPGSLLGVEVFADGLLHGPPGSPVAFEIRFGWVLAETVLLHTTSWSAMLVPLLEMTC